MFENSKSVPFMTFSAHSCGCRIEKLRTLTRETPHSTNGIGREMLEDESLFNVSGMWGVIVLLGLLGMILNALFGLVERRVLRWQPPARSGT